MRALGFYPRSVGSIPTWGTRSLDNKRLMDALEEPRKSKVNVAKYQGCNGDPDKGSNGAWKLVPEVIKLTQGSV